MKASEPNYPSPDPTPDLTSLSAGDRYDVFVSECALQGEVWTLRGEGGFVAFKDDEGAHCFPFWPAPEFAELLAREDWDDCRAESLALEEFMARWLTGMARDGRQVSVFPDADGSGIVADPLQLLQDLREALQPVAAAE